MKAGNIICSFAPADEKSIELARAWVEQIGFTADEVRIVKRENTINVILKKDWENGEG